MINKKVLKNYFQKLDYVLIVTALALAGCGLVVIFSATRSLDSGTRQMVVQIAAGMMGICLMLVLAAIDYESYTEFAKYIFIGSIAVLIFVLIFGEGKEETGANSWIRIAGIGIQPSELVKLSFAVTFSIHLAKVKENINSIRTVAMLLLHFGVLFGLVILQNDTGTALVFLFMFLCMLFVAGISYKYVLAAIGAGVAALPLMWFLLSDYQKNRILVFLNPERDAAGAGFQVMPVENCGWFWTGVWARLFAGTAEPARDAAGEGYRLYLRRDWRGIRFYWLAVDFGFAAAFDYPLYLYCAKGKK